MAYKLVIANVVKVPVKFTLDDAGVSKEFKFTISCERLGVDEIKERTQDGTARISDFLKGIMHGWEGQKLVVDDEGKPADFNPDSLNVMLNTAGVATVLYNRYLNECGAKGKN